MKDLPIGVQTFSELIQNNYLYVDKTRHIYNLFANGGKYYFLSRPRRFGKSLLVSTLEEIFSGNKRLFKGLWIYDKIEWKKYPIIHIDFSHIGYDNGEILKEALTHRLDKIAAAHKISLPARMDYKTRFTDLIEALGSKAPVVIMVDEYDKPIIDLIDKKELAMENRDILRNFYSAIKGSDKYIKFAFITGVSKFSKVSVFSGLNNLNDITIDEEYATFLGYTDEELLHYFDDRIDQVAEGSNRADWLEDIKNWYNGYSWDGKNFVYNPLSILHFFQKRRFGNYWFESGTPSFLIKAIKKYHFDVTQLEHYRAGEAIFESFDIERMNVASLLFQTGYLTIKEVEQIDRTQRLYVFSYPNTEVKESLLEHILGEFSARFANEVSVIVHELRKSLAADDMERFIEIAKSVYAKIPYDMIIEEQERYYQTVMYLVLLLIGINIQTEVETNLGRVDAVIETASHVYVMEFKMGSAREALKQIHDKKYYQKFLTSAKKIKLIGIGFDAKQRNIRNYRIEEI